MNLNDALSKSLNLSDEVGPIHIGTAYVAMRNLYLTVAVVGTPFDMMIAATEEEARKNHAHFVESAKLTASLLEAMPQDGLLN